MESMYIQGAVPTSSTPNLQHPEKTFASDQPSQFNYPQTGFAFNPRLISGEGNGTGVPKQQSTSVCRTEMKNADEGFVYHSPLRVTRLVNWNNSCEWSVLNM